MPIPFLAGLFNRKPKQNKQNLSAKDQSFVASQVGALTSSNYAVATDAGIDGMLLFREAAKKLANVDLDKRQGNLFEYIEATKFNIDAAIKGASVRAHVTAAEGLPHHPADVLLKEGNRIVKEVQMKSCNPESYNGKGIAHQTFEISDSKYRGMQKVVNTGHEDRVRELAMKRAQTGTNKAGDYTDTAKNVNGRTWHQKVDSRGTPYPETEGAARNPEGYALSIEMKQIGKEVMVTGAQAAAAGAIMGGAISTIKNVVAVSKGELSCGEATLNTIRDTAKTGGRSGLTGMVGAGIRSGAKKVGLNSLTKSNVATAVAAGVIDAGVTVLCYAKGEISADEALERIGQNGVSTASSIYAGAAAGAIFGPVGAVVGSVAGYLVASNVYQSCLAIFKDASLSEEEAARIVAFSKAACEQMKIQRQQFESMFEERLNARRNEFNRIFSRIDASINNNNNETIIALSDFTMLFGENLKMQDFNEFNTFMKGNEDLIL